MESADNRFTINGDLERLLAGVEVVNEFGGGQASSPSLTDPWGVDIQGVARIA
jgi:hypothetical protein